MKQKPAFLLTLLIATTFFVTAVSAEGVMGFDPSVKGRIDSLLASFPQDGAGGVVMVVEKGELLYSGTYGFAQIEWGISNSMEACYRIGSVTKTFTALAVLHLAESGKLSPDDKANKWFPDVPMDDRITLAHLLSHTSGLVQGTSEPEFVPGEKMNYSNYGYILLGKLVEKVSGRSYEQYLHDHIFSPLGMQQSGYDHYRDIIPGRAAGYEMLNGQTVNLGFTDIEGAGGAGALYSSGADLMRFAKELSHNRVLPAQLLAASMQPFTLNNGSASSYGMGWMTRIYRGWREASHGGDIDGFNCYFAHFPDRQITIVVLQNMKMQMNTEWANGGRLAHRLVDLIWDGELEPGAPVLPTVTIPVEVLQRLVGTYAFENAPGEMIAAMGASISFFVEDGQLMVRDKTGTVRLEAVGESEFVLPGIDIRIKFQADNGTHPAGLNLVLLSVRDLYARRVE
jgi:CubicO group peptidase (beta-lactamase class C family)